MCIRDSHNLLRRKSAIICANSVEKLQLSVSPTFFNHSRHHYRHWVYFLMAVINRLWWMKILIAKMRGVKQIVQWPLFLYIRWKKPDALLLVIFRNKSLRKCSVSTQLLFPKHLPFVHLFCFVWCVYAVNYVYLRLLPPFSLCSAAISSPVRAWRCSLACEPRSTKISDHKTSYQYHHYLHAVHQWINYSVSLAQG